VRYWDASALVPLLLTESATPAVRGLLEEDPQVVTFWTTEVECASAIARLEREGRLAGRPLALALDRLGALRRAWSEVSPLDSVRDRARRLLRTHPLRTADSLQLAAALVASEERPTTLDFVCLDSRLASAAGKEGFPVLPRESA
jgi:predicted nucleic acid-binding protein